MADPNVTAQNLINGLFDVLQGDNAFKAKTMASIIDQLIGSDTNAVVKHIPGIPESIFETISDGLIGALENAILTKLQQPQP